MARPRGKERRNLRAMRVGWTLMVTLFFLVPVEQHLIVLLQAENGNKDASATKEGKEKDTAPHPPAKKFRMTDSMKNIVWELVLLSNECCRLENEKKLVLLSMLILSLLTTKCNSTLEGSVLQVSEQGLRKVLYQKIVAAFPDGWMSSGQISRDGGCHAVEQLVFAAVFLIDVSVSAMKKRLEKENMENE